MVVVNGVKYIGVWKDPDGHYWTLVDSIFEDWAATGAEEIDEEGVMWKEVEYDPL